MSRVGLRTVAIVLNPLVQRNSIQVVVNPFVLAVLGGSRNNYLYRRVIDNRKWKSIYMSSRDNKTASENLF